MMLRQEAEQIHRRITWLASFQGFLFAALGLAWGKNHQLTQVFAGLGISVSLLVLLAVLAAIRAVERLRQGWLDNQPPNYSGPGIMGFYPTQAPLSVYTSPEMLLPLAFAVAWLCVLFIAPTIP